MRSRKTLELIQTCPEDRPVAVQIYGSNAREMKDAAQWLEGYGVSSVDINMGCPVHKVTRGGGGSALMCDAGNTVDPGAYTYSVVAANGGTAVNATALSFSQVAAVKQGDSGVSLELAAGRSISLSDVRMFL